MLEIFWSSRSRNSKTGDVPTAWIGSSFGAAKKSCSGCSLLEKGCYAYGGSPLLGHLSVTRTQMQKPDNYKLEYALNHRNKKARMVRVTALGDIGRSGRAVADAVVAEIKASGLALVGYTHHWREPAVIAAWHGRLMASCDDMEAADQAVSNGWRACVTVPSNHPRISETPEGRKVVVCPAQVKEDHSITCNTCRLCDGSKAGPIISFRAHGRSHKALDERFRANTGG